MKKIRKLLIILPVLCLMIFFFRSCGREYGYGVKKNDPQRIYPEMYRCTHDRGYRFETRISELPNIEIDHLKPVFADSTKVQISIRFNCAQEDIYSLKVNLRTKQGKLIQPIEVIPLRDNNRGYGTKIEYIQIYRIFDIPKKLIQTVTIDIQAGDEREFLNFHFPLKYTTESTVWERMLNVT